MRVKELAASGATTHVVIVCDREEHRNLLKMLREANGYRVKGASDKLEAPGRRRMI